MARLSVPNTLKESNLIMNQITANRNNPGGGGNANWKNNQRGGGGP